MKADAASDRVLLVTGGFFDPRGSSLRSHIARIVRYIGVSRHAWLDLKNILLFAEPVLAARWDRLRRGAKNAAPPGPRASKADTGEVIPDLTEALLMSLLGREGLACERLSVQEALSGSAQARRRIRSCATVFLSTTYLHSRADLEIVLDAVRSRSNHIVVGGPLTGLMEPSSIARFEAGVWAVGYGEYLVPVLAGWIRSGWRELLAPLRGRVQKRGTLWTVHSGVPESNDLDHLPEPDWAGLRPLWSSLPAALPYEGARGCAHRCAFCNYPYLFEETALRTKSAERMADDWERLAKEHGVRGMVCLDSLFTKPKTRLLAFCRELIARKVFMRWSFYGRSDDLAEERTVALLRAAGAGEVHIGLESGDPEILRNMRKGYAADDNQRALANCRRQGITTVASLVVGFPGESRDTLTRTMALMREYPPDFYFLAPFSTRIPRVPVLSAEYRRRFGLQTHDNPRSFAPYWRHRTMSCWEAIDHARRLDRELMQDEISLNALLFYRPLAPLSPEARRASLAQQHEIALACGTLRRLLNGFHALVNRAIHRDMSRVFLNEDIAGQGSARFPHGFGVSAREGRILGAAVEPGDPGYGEYDDSIVKWRAK